MLSEIERRLSEFSPAERRVARWLLAHPEQAVEATLQQWAEHCAVSEPTVVRFCKAAGADSFQNFKRQLDRGLASQQVFFHHNINPSDQGETLLAKIFDSAVASMLSAKDSLTGEAIDQAIDAIRQAQRVEIYGIGGSGIVAQDAEQKLFRLGIVVSAWSDPHIHRVSAALLNANAVVIAISHSGETQSLIDSVTLARQTGATIITLSRYGSRLSALADVSLCIDIQEDSDLYAPIKARLVQLSVLDAIAIGIACRDPDSARKKLEIARQALQ